MKKLVIYLALVVAGLSGGHSAFAQTTDAKGSAANPAPTGSPEAVIPKQASDENQYLIGFQDILDIQVMRHPDLVQRVAVGSTGTITLFRMPEPIVAVCKTANQLAKDIAKAYVDAKYLRDPQINVMVAEQKSQSFAVIGAVEKPGNYFISRRVHLLELLAYAGGPSKESGTRIIVARAGSNSSCKEPSIADDNLQVMDFKIRDVQEGKQTLWMQAGDVVSVLDADIVYMYGSLNKQGALKIRDTITLTQAIASAEGLKPTAKTDKVRVLRQVPGKTDREEFIYDLAQISKGKIKDPYLEPNDIVAISQDATKTILRGITETLKNSVPAAAYAL